MNTYRILVTIAISVISLTSCTKQQFTCVCYGGWGGEYITKYKKHSIEKAQRQCESNNDGPAVYDGTYGCHLE